MRRKMLRWLWHRWWYWELKAWRRRRPTTREWNKFWDEEWDKDIDEADALKKTVAAGVHYQVLRLDDDG